MRVWSSGSHWPTLGTRLITPVDIILIVGRVLRDKRVSAKELSEFIEREE